MHLLFLTRTYPPTPGAVGHLVKELAEALSGAGHHLTIITSGRDEQGKIGNDIRVVRVGGLPFTRRSHVKRALSYLSLYPALFLAAARQRRPDLVVTTTDPPLQAVLGVLLKLRFNCRLVHWCQDLYPEMAEEVGVLKKGGRFAALLRWMSSQALVRQDSVVSIGRCMTERLLARGLDPKKITEIANWTDPEWIQPVADLDNAFSKRENLAGRFVVLYSGNLGLAHSFSEVLNAAASLQRTAPDVLFLFVGEGPQKAEVEQETKDRSLGNVRFLPAQAWEAISQSLGAGQVHLVTLCANMAGLVVPSKFYGGMASGRPCLFVGPKNSEVARLIEENQLGRVIENGDSGKLIEAILEYRRNPESRRSDGARARIFGEESNRKRAVACFNEILT